MVEQWTPTPCVRVRILPGSISVASFTPFLVMFKKLKQFLKEVYVEIKDKTTWPTRDDVLNTTIVVCVSIVILSIALYLVDLVSARIIRFIVVDNVSFLKTYVTEFSYVVMVVVLVILAVAYNRIKARFKRW